MLLNQRNCGGTERHAPGLYHSGLTADAAHVMAELARVDGIGRIVVAGYSLGGNLALKLAGDYGDAPPPQARMDIMTASETNNSPKFRLVFMQYPPLKTVKNGPPHSPRKGI